MFYAIEYHYGSNIIVKDGMIDRVFAFKTMKERDEWVFKGTPWIGEGERDPLPTNHKMLRYYKKHNNIVIYNKGCDKLEIK